MIESNDGKINQVAWSAAWVELIYRRVVCAAGTPTAPDGPILSMRTTGASDERPSSAA